LKDSFNIVKTPVNGSFHFKKTKNYISYNYVITPKQNNSKVSAKGEIEKVKTVVNEDGSTSVVATAKTDYLKYALFLLVPFGVFCLGWLLIKKFLK
jgi:hypothetical protein